MALLLALAYTFLAHSVGQKLYREGCTLKSEPAQHSTENRNSNSTDHNCVAEKHLECVQGRCDCMQHHVHDGDCGCRWGLIGIGSKCIQDFGRTVETCDFTRNLTCDPVYLRCRCPLNHFYDDGVCLPGESGYGEACHVPDQYRTESPPNDDSQLGTSSPVVQLNQDTSTSPGIQFDQTQRETEPLNRKRRDSDLKVSTTAVTRGRGKLTDRLINGIELPPMRKTDIPTPRRHYYHPRNFTRKPMSAINSDLYPKCNSSRFLTLAEQKMENETELESFLTQGSGDRCNPNLNLHCATDVCLCINEKTSGMYRRSKQGPGCKKTNLYSCSNNADCLSGNCVPEPGSGGRNSTSKLCLKFGLKKFPENENFSYRILFNWVLILSLNVLVFLMRGIF